jgi:integrase
MNQILRETLQKIPRRLNNPYIFTGRNGKPFRDIKGSFASALRKAGIKDFKFHDLRHTFASHLVMEGVDLATIKELLGHKNLTMTLRYAHLAPGHKARAVSVMEKLLDRNPTIQKVYNLREFSPAGDS